MRGLDFKTEATTTSRPALMETSDALVFELNRLDEISEQLEKTGFVTHDKLDQLLFSRPEVSQGPSPDSERPDPSGAQPVSNDFAAHLDAIVRRFRRSNDRVQMLANQASRNLSHLSQII